MMKRATTWTNFLLSALLALPVWAQLTPTPLVSPNAQSSGAFGISVSGAGDVNNDGTPDVIVGALDETVGGISAAGRAYIFNGSTGALIRTLVSPNPETTGRFGQAVSEAGDVNLDGFDDVMVTAILENSNATDAGRVYVFSGADGSVLHTLLSPLPKAFGDFGLALGSIGDVNSDGRPDLLVGARNENPGGVVGAGRAYIFSGLNGSLLRTLNSPSPRITGEFGASVDELEDVNGDNVPDVIVGAQAEMSSGNGSAGNVHILSGANGSLIQTLLTPNPDFSGNFGYAAANAGDVNNDGKSDIVVGAYGENGGANDAGRAYIFSGANWSVLRSLVSPNPQATGWFGSSVAGAGDINNDGFDDVIIGADFENGGATTAGRAYIFSGQNGVRLQTLQSPNASGSGEFGISVDRINTEDSSQPGVIVGAAFENAGSASFAGRAYLYKASITNCSLALNKPATASSSNGSFPPGNGNDGNASTHWRSGSLGSTTAAWWRVDLGATFTVTGVNINWRGTYYAKKYKVQISLTGSSWTTVHTNNAGNGGVDNVTFAGVSARYVRVRMTQHNSTTERINEVEVCGAASSALAKASEVAKSEAVADYVLEQNYPNPFNPGTTIKFALPAAGKVMLHVYNEVGQLVRALAEGEMSAGHHVISWDGRNAAGAAVASGIYFYRLAVHQASGEAVYTETKRMVLVQ